MKTAFKIALAAVAFSAAPALAQDKATYTVEQCITILNGLNALNCVGQQLNGSCAPDAKQYKLGDTRYDIGRDISALTGILTDYQRAQQKFMAELPPIPDYDHGSADHPKPVPLEVQQAQADQNKKSITNQIAMLGKPCVMGGPLLRLKQPDLKMGDNPDQNAIPPSVFAAFSPIVDK
jgi:hypothetical protein